MITNEMARLIQEADVKVHFDLDDGVLVISNLDKFAALVAAAERDRLEPAFERLETLMKIREGQPNKPCCLAERERIIKLLQEMQRQVGDAHNHYGFAAARIKEGV